MSGTPRRAWTSVATAVLIAAAGCAADPGDRLPDGGAAPDVVADVVAETVVDRPPDLATDGFVSGPDGGPGPLEPPLMVRNCAGGAGGAGGSGGDQTCCPSALDFEDGTTEHFLPASCCRLALSAPQVAPMPTSCGHGALRLTADFWATDDSSMCGTPGENPACAHTAGEVTRAVLAPLTLAGRTASVMVYLQGPALPPGPVLGSLFVVGPGGLIESPPVPLTRAETWTAIELAIPPDADGPGADVQVLGVRVAFGGQAWVGKLYLDELTWH